MDKVEEIINTLTELKKVYEEENFESLKKVKKEIKEVFKDFLKENKENYNLVFTNSVHIIDLFEVEDRVKKPDSLFEKFIRKNDGLSIIRELDLKNINDIQIKKDSIVQYFNLYEDIIGIKIKTELNEDCKNVYKLLLEKENTLKDIEFLNIKEQPKTMKNGLEIYNIKARYKGDYGFELQIKSKINSAWGDLDHSVFYKNYTYNPIKDTVQITMNHVGNILHEIENHLFSLRSANSDYEGKARKLKFLERLSEAFGNEIKEKFHSYYQLEQLSDLILFIYEDIHNEKFDGEVINSENKNFYYMYFIVENEKIKNYLSYRDKSFDTIILENIILNLVVGNEIAEMSQDNYETIIQSNLDRIISYISNEISEDEDEVEDNKYIIENIIYFLFCYVENVGIFTNINSYKILNNWNKLFLEEIDSEEEKEKIKQIWAVKLHGGKLEEFIDDNHDNLPLFKDRLEEMRQYVEGFTQKENFKENPNKKTFINFLEHNKQIIKIIDTKMEVN